MITTTLYNFIKNKQSLIHVMPDQISQINEFDYDGKKIMSYNIENVIHLAYMLDKDYPLFCFSSKPANDSIINLIELKGIQCYVGESIYLPTLNRFLMLFAIHNNEAVQFITGASITKLTSWDEYYEEYMEGFRQFKLFLKRYYQFPDKDFKYIEKILIHVVKILDEIAKPMHALYQLL